ncbi:MAG: hypothetical protein H6624_12260 [Bdellovibrionaceae bacterium]|nr:hypothetical protein [Bdellovibrionales bacterium]MCB9085116.1 hypothetical protein [Pseudobdellovibrionaceae bacterium]
MKILAGILSLVIAQASAYAVNHNCIQELAELNDGLSAELTIRAVNVLNYDDQIEHQVLFKILPNVLESSCEDANNNEWEFRVDDYVKLEVGTHSLAGLIGEGDDFDLIHEDWYGAYTYINNSSLRVHQAAFATIMAEAGFQTFEHISASPYVSLIDFTGNKSVRGGRSATKFPYSVKSMTAVGTGAIGSNVYQVSVGKITVAIEE